MYGPIQRLLSHCWKNLARFARLLAALLRPTLPWLRWTSAHTIILATQSKSVPLKIILFASQSTEYCCRKWRDKHYNLPFSLVVVIQSPPEALSGISEAGRTQNNIHQLTVLSFKFTGICGDFTHRLAIKHQPEKQKGKQMYGWKAKRCGVMTNV